MNLQGWETVEHSALHVEFKNQKIWLRTVFYITHEENDKLTDLDQTHPIENCILQRQIPVCLSLENKLLSSV